MMQASVEHETVVFEADLTKKSLNIILFVFKQNGDHGLTIKHLGI